MKTETNARLKNIQWNLCKNHDDDGTWSTSHDDRLVALLMDLRDEMQSIRQVLQCANFLRIPSKLDAIVTNTKKLPRKRKLKLVKRKAA